MEMNLELYRIFYMVATCGNISQASERLFISQPAVSKSIKKLENISGVTLFSRNSRGVKLTEEGKVFFDYIERGLNEISTGEKILTKLIKKEQGIIRLGVSSTLCRHFLIPRLENFINEYPKIRIKIINKTTFDTLKLMQGGTIDLCVVSEPAHSDSYSFIKLSEIQDIFIASKRYLKLLNTKDPKEIFSKGNLMLLESDNITRRYIDKYFENNNIFVKPEVEISNMDFLIEFAKIGLGITAVIEDFVKNELEEGSLVKIPLYPSIPKRNVGVVYCNDVHLSIAAQAFLEYLLD